MKKIIVFTNHYYPEQFKINELVQDISSEALRTHVVTQTPNYPKGSFFAGYAWFKKNKESVSGYSTVQRLPVIPRGSSSIMLILNYMSYYFSSFMFSMFNKDNYDAVYVYATSPIFVAKAGLRVAKKQNVKSVLYLLDMWPGNLFAMFPVRTKLLRTIITNMCIKIYKRFDTICISSLSFKKQLLEYGVLEENIIYIPQHADAVSVQWMQPSNQKREIIFAGNIGKAQGLDVLVETAVYLKTENNHNVRFTILGDGRGKGDLKELIKRNEVEDYFILLDAVSAHEVPDILIKYDFAFVSLVKSPVLDLTLPAKVQTYMSLGIPILASGDGEIKLIIEESQSGFIAPPGDSKQLSRIINSFESMSKEAFAQLGINGYNYSQEHFKKEIIVEKFKEVLEDTHNV